MVDSFSVKFMKTQNLFTFWRSAKHFYENNDCVLCAAYYILRVFSSISAKWRRRQIEGGYCRLTKLCTIKISY